MAYNKETGMYEGYIYKITNDINDKIYIGQTVTDLNTRFSQHKYDAKNNKRNMYIYKAMRKYGINNFDIEEIEKFEFDNKKELINILNEREIYYIQKYNTTNCLFGYNMTSGGNNPSENNYRKICQYSISGELIKIWDSISEAANCFNVKKNSIFSACNGLTNISCGYVWRYIEDDFNTYLVKTKNKICQYDKNGNLLNIYYRESFPKEYNIKNVLEVCNGKFKTHKNYVWRYESDPFDKYEIKWKQRKTIRSVSCYYDDKYITSYESAKIATKIIKLKSTSTIYTALKDHSKSAGGYKWFYSDDPEQPDKSKIIV